MKKKIAVTILIIVSAVLTLTSCKVNWFDRQYDVPWWMIAVPAVIFSVIVISAAGKHIASKKYTCGNCGRSFYPTMLEAMFSVHINDDRYFRCPHCKSKGFCSISRDTDDRK